MRYPHLPPVGSLALPELPYSPSPNRSSRHGAIPTVVFVHRWGGGSFKGVRDYLKKPTTPASSHIVYAGERGPDAGKAVQLVPWSQKAWTEASYNPIGLSIESADAIWLGHDPEGFARLARIVAGLLVIPPRMLGIPALPARWVHGTAILHQPHGFARHADGGALAGGHTSCPTTDLELWKQFCNRVVAEHREDGFRKTWGKK